MPPDRTLPFAARPVPGPVNWLGLWTLVRMEMGRFTRTPLSSFAAPALTAWLFYAVFALAAPPDLAPLPGVAFLAFIVPGLVVMTVAQNAFETTAWSIVDLKVRGAIVDLLMPPLGTGELLVAFVLCGAARGLALGVLILVPMLLHAGAWPPAPLVALAFGTGAALLFALAGIVCGVVAVKYDHVASFANFVVVPLTFLSGAFYPLAALDEPWRGLSLANPLFHAVDGARAGLVGAGQSSLALGALVLAVAVAASALAAWRLLARSPKLRP